MVPLFNRLRSCDAAFPVVDFTLTDVISFVLLAVLPALPLVIVPLLPDDVPTSPEKFARVSRELT